MRPPKGPQKTAKPPSLLLNVQSAESQIKRPQSQTHSDKDEFFYKKYLREKEQ